MIGICCPCFNNFCPLQYGDNNYDDNAIGYLHVGVILLLRPESFSSFFSYLDLTLPLNNKSPHLHKKAKLEGF